MTLYVERAQFVVAPQDSGKSSQLRSIFLDRRFGMDGQIPSSSQQKKLPDTYYISNERRLYLRLTSPNEYGETPKEFIDKTRGKMGDGRWSFLGPLQPDAFKQMPDVVDSVKYFINAFNPERVRVVFLSPNRHGTEVDNFIPGRDLRDELLQIGVEVACIDARRRAVNGLMLADFFDFT
jgi:hypothetical protein